MAGCDEGCDGDDGAGGGHDGERPIVAAAAVAGIAEVRKLFVIAREGAVAAADDL